MPTLCKRALHRSPPFGRSLDSRPDIEVAFCDFNTAASSVLSSRHLVAFSPPRYLVALASNGANRTTRFLDVMGRAESGDMNWLRFVGSY